MQNSFLLQIWTVTEIHLNSIPTPPSCTPFWSKHFVLSCSFYCLSKLGKFCIICIVLFSSILWQLEFNLWAANFLLCICYTIRTQSWMQNLFLLQNQNMTEISDHRISQLLQETQCHTVVPFWSNFLWQKWNWHWETIFIMCNTFMVKLWWPVKCCSENKAFTIQWLHRLIKSVRITWLNSVSQISYSLLYWVLEENSQCFTLWIISQ